MKDRSRWLSLSSCVLIVGAAILALGVWLGSAQHAAGATTLCVQPGSVSCFSTISAALSAANDGDTIQVAAGTYIEYVVITKTVTVQGGWNADFTARDPSAHPTIIRPPDASFSVVHIQGQFGVPTATRPTFDGFIVTGGGGGNHGGGIRVTSSNAIISTMVPTVAP